MGRYMARQNGEPHIIAIATPANRLAERELQELPSGLSHLTVRIALLLTTLPPLLLTVTAKMLPLSDKVVGGVM